MKHQTEVSSREENKNGIMPNIDMNLSAHPLFPGIPFQSKYQCISEIESKENWQDSVCN